MVALFTEATGRFAPSFYVAIRVGKAHLYVTPSRAEKGGR